MANKKNAQKDAENSFYESLAGESNQSLTGAMLRQIILDTLAMKQAVANEPISISMQGKLDKAKQQLMDEGFLDPDPDNNAPLM